MAHCFVAELTSFSQTAIRAYDGMLSPSTIRGAGANRELQPGVSTCHP
jgi:hypothetical protein